MLLLASEAGADREVGLAELDRLVADALFAHGRDALLVVEAQRRRVVRHNPAAERIFGRGLDGAPLDDLLTWLDDPAENGPEPLADGRARAATALRRSGELLPVEVVAVPAAGGSVALLVRPIDDAARAEAAERELNRVLSVVNHDLRTPLTSIVGFAELLIERKFAPERQRQLLGFIKREGARLEELIAQLPRSNR
jgi:signal transduction histidine kinase